MDIRVLVVEEDEGDAFLMQSLLTELREPDDGGATFLPTTVTSLDPALEILRARRCDVVILDLETGGLHGMEALHTLINTAPEIPIVVVTSRDDLELGLHSVEAGAQDHLVKAELVGNRLARAVLYAIEREKQRAALRARTIVDELTGLYNRRGFFTLGEQTLSLMRRRGRELVVVFVDLDGLKRVNDSYGHQAGDDLIRRAAGLLRSTFRDSDIVARIGGGEFAVVANETEEGSLATIMERLRTALANHNALLGPDHQLSMSIGAVRHNVVVDADLSQLLARADSEMYVDKRHHLSMN